MVKFSDVGLELCKEKISYGVIKLELLQVQVY